MEKEKLNYKMYTILQKQTYRRQNYKMEKYLFLFIVRRTNF